MQLIADYIKVQFFTVELGAKGGTKLYLESKPCSGKASAESETCLTPQQLCKVHNLNN